MLLFRDITVKSVACGGFLLKFLACHSKAEHVQKLGQIAHWTEPNWTILESRNLKEQNIQENKDKVPAEQS